MSTWSFEYQRPGSFIDLVPNHSDSIFLNFFSSINPDFNISLHSGERYRTNGPWFWIYSTSERSTRGREHCCIYHYCSCPTHWNWVYCYCLTSKGSPFSEPITKLRIFQSYELHVALQWDIWSTCSSSVVWSICSSSVIWSTCSSLVSHMIYM